MLWYFRVLHFVLTKAVTVALYEILMCPRFTLDCGRDLWFTWNRGCKSAVTYCPDLWSSLDSLKNKKKINFLFKSL